MKKSICILSAASLIAAPAIAQPRYTMGNQPVTLSAMGDLDPCSLGEIADLGPESQVDVYEGPSDELEPFDALAWGQKVWICDTDPETGMVGIVYSKFDDVDCEVSSPVEEDTDYMGPCESGWVYEYGVDLLAG